MANGSGPGAISGLVVKGAVQASTVTAYPLDASMNRGPALGTAATAQDGTFKLTLPAYNGALEIVAFGGTYPEEAVGVPVQLTHELSFVVPSYQSGGSVTATLSPVSSMVRGLARAAMARGSTLADAVSAAWTHLDNHFGGLDWRAVVPTNVSPSQKTTVTMSDATVAGLILAGFSQAARTMAEASSLTPGTSITGATLAGAGADDAGDGTLDGMAGAVALTQGTVTLNNNAFRRGLGQAIVKFVGSSYNNTQLTAADVLALANALAANSDPYLFCPNQTAAASCAGGALQIAPPNISLINPPTFVGAHTVTLQATASDPIAGVTAVYAQTAGGTLVTGTLSGGVWMLAGVPLVEGPNALYVWGVDAAGAGSLATATQITVTADTQPVVPYVVTAAPSYYDERTMGLANGTVPPAYTFAVGATKTPAAPAVYKAATRLGWGATPTAAILEGANPDNIPYVQFAVPVSSTRAPIATASYSINDGTTTYTGDLMPWKSPSSTATTEFYDVPLAAATAPSVATSATALALSVKATITNAVGTSGTQTQAVTFNVVGPPLFIAEDATYGAAGDAKSAFPYFVAGGTYATLWNTPGLFLNGQVRLLRYVITNPASLPVAVSAAFTGTWTASETSQRSLGVDPCTVAGACATDAFGNVTYTVDSQTFGEIATTSAQASSVLEGCTVSTQAIVHFIGSATRATCSPMTDFPWGGYATPWPAFTTVPTTTTTTFAWTTSAAASSAAFANPSPTGGEATPATPIGSMVLVPAAVGTTPGAIVVYVVRPYSGRSVWFGGTEAVTYRMTAWGSGGCCGLWQYTLTGVNKTLTAATESVSGTMAFAASGVSGSTLVGSASSLPANVISRLPLVTH